MPVLRSLVAAVFIATLLDYLVVFFMLIQMQVSLSQVAAVCVATALTVVVVGWLFCLVHV
jgi:hypothetical protein